MKLDIENKMLMMKSVAYSKKIFFLRLLLVPFLQILLTIIVITIMFREPNRPETQNEHTVSRTFSDT